MVSIRHYFFPEISIKANPEYKPTDDSRDIIDEHITVSWDEMCKDDEDEFSIFLEFKLDGAEVTSVPYKISIMAYGLFDTDSNTREDHCKAASILLGSVREQVSSLTARGPWDEIIIEPYTFTPEEE